VSKSNNEMRNGYMRYNNIYLGRLDVLFIYYNLCNVVFSILKYVTSNVKDDAE